LTCLYLIISQNYLQNKGLKPIELYIAIILVIGLGDSLIIFADQEDKLLYSNWVLIINSSIAAGIAIYVTLSEKNNHNHLKANIFLVLGLGLWFLANTIWAYYEVVLHLMAPVPSLADVLLLMAYSILISRLVIEYKCLPKKPSKKFIGVLAALVGAFLLYFFGLTIDLSVVSTPRGLTMFGVTVAYPAFNSVLAIIAIIILYGIKNEKEKHHITWVCELAGFLVIVVGDSWFAIIVLTGFVEQLWASALLLSAHYIIIAGGLVWYVKLLRQPDHSSLYSNSLLPFLLKRKNMLIIIMIVSLVIVMPLTNHFFINASHENSFLSTIFFRDDFPTPFRQNDHEITIGLITSISGAWASGGKAIKVAAELAEKDVNNYFENKNSSIRIRLLTENSKTDPVETIRVIQRLTDSGAKIIIGPATSAALMSIKDYAMKHDIILISPSSTSPALSTPGDNIFRFVPDDRNQAKFIAEKMWHDGVRVVIPMWRGDIFGNGLVNAMKANFEKLGGKVLEGIEYPPHVGEFSSSLHRINFIMWNQHLKKLSYIVENSTSLINPREVGIYLVAYDEVTPILIQSNEFNFLDNVRWYGSDATALNMQIIRNFDAAHFADITNFSNPLYSVNLRDTRALTVGAQLEHQLHDAGAVTYPVLAYDAVWVASLSLEKIDNNPEIDIVKLKNIINGTARSYNGISGKIILNGAGDRVNGNYDLWSVSLLGDDTGRLIWRQEINNETVLSNTPPH
jgi:branched-chain amino acid transport system substrate-binding protein